MRYDEKALIQVVEVTVGGRDRRAEKSRREMLQGYGRSFMPSTLLMGLRTYWVFNAVIFKLDDCGTTS